MKKNIFIAIILALTAVLAFDLYSLREETKLTQRDYNQNLILIDGDDDEDFYLEEDHNG